MAIETNELDIVGWAAMFLGIGFLLGGVIVFFANVGNNNAAYLQGRIDCVEVKK